MSIFFNDTATTEIYTYLHTLSLHDALPIFFERRRRILGEHLGDDRAGVVAQVAARLAEHQHVRHRSRVRGSYPGGMPEETAPRSEEHTSELQSLMRISYAVFCLKKKTKTHKRHRATNQTIVRTNKCN